MDEPVPEPTPLPQSLPIGERLRRVLPRIEPYPWHDGCWLATVMSRSPEHHPPLYWLGRALDEVASIGLLDEIVGHIEAVHGPEACPGWSPQDERAQDVLTEACALAWAHVALSALPAEHIEANDGVGSGPILAVPGLGVRIAPRRLRPVRTFDDIVRQVQRLAANAATDLGPLPGGILYLDLPLNSQGWAHDVGYASDVTEPLKDVVRHFGAEHRLGYVLTRPFQWSAPIEAAY
jgi:hypothetical protein